MLFRRLWERCRQVTARELFVLIPLLFVVIGVWGFVALADEVGEGDTMHFDRWAVRAMRRSDDPSHTIGPAWLEEVGRDVTALGGVAVLSLLTLITAGFLAQQQKFRMMCLLLAASGSGVLVSFLLKSFFSRPRPDIVKPLSMVFTSSFPSGHSMLSAVVYLTLGTLLAESSSDRGVKIYCMAVAAFLPFIVGVSRVYMGVHYPTDVLAGWTAGLVWAIGCWTVGRFLQRSGTVEQPSQPDAEAETAPHVS